jgi:hypothetical protein
MNLTETQNHELRIFCQEITYKPRMLDAQPCERSGAHIWCEDWKIIEILKFLFLGEDCYMRELPPRRLRNNPLWSKEAIKKEAVQMWADFGGNVNDIVGYLRSKRFL